MRYIRGHRIKTHDTRTSMVTAAVVVAAAGLFSLCYPQLNQPGAEPFAPVVLAQQFERGRHRGNRANATAEANAAITLTKGTPITEDNLLTNGQWSYLPGTTLTAQKQLEVRPTPFTIVEQDGTGGQPNPPINLLGTHITVSGNFEVALDMTGTTDTTASVQLYGSVPVIADEFRVEGRSVRMSLTNGKLTVNTWDGNKQTSTDKTYTYPPSDTIHLRFVRKGTQMIVVVNEHVFATMPEAGMFKSGNVWFGIDAKGGNGWKLTGMQAFGREGGTVTTHNTDQQAPVTRTGLQAQLSAKRPNMTIGAAMALGPLTTDEQYRKTALGNFGSLTTENSLKWQFVHPTRDIYDFHETDALVAIAKKHNMAVHAHTLVFGEANPPWVQALPAAEREAVMLDHIKTVAGHYKGQVYSWDVINEPFDDDEWSELRQHVWYQAMGESYIPKALQAARAADPNAKLFINEYGIEEDGDRWDAMLALVTKLKQQGVPIDGVGFQSHVYESADKINPAVLRKHMQQLAAIGLLARVSEMDVYIEDGQQVQASQYQQIFGACLAEPNCVSFTTWGVSDRYDWFKDGSALEQGEDFLWDRNMQPTPAVAAIQQLLQ